MTGQDIRWRDVGGIDALFWDLRRSCALGRVLQIGCGEGQLVQRLIEHGVDAFGVDSDATAIAEAERYAPGRFLATTATAIPCGDAEFETVICVDWLTSVEESEVDRLIAEIRRVASRHVFITVKADAGRCSGNRDWWDARFIRAGFRRHPSLLRIIDYAALEKTSGRITLLYDRIADAALAEYPVERLAAERDLHMDMLREAGRRSDAHLQRYAAAAALVRPNDVVLDAACGLGYGLAIVAATGRASRLIGIDDSKYAIDYAKMMFAGAAGQIEFNVGDAHALDGIANHSVDLVTSFETVEHLAEPRTFLANVARVLKPGGRFIGSVPNEWLDESGRDPNPHHLHVFNADRFVGLFDAPFLVEHLIAETAGGGMKVLKEPVRTWRTVDRRDAGNESAEWWVVVAMKDPRAGTGVPYVETVHAVAEGAHRPAAVSFADAYENPWLRNALVSQGIRISDAELLATVAHDVEGQATPGSVDQAAAICVQGYRLLSTAVASHDEIAASLARIDAWLGNGGGSIHHFRWHISLEFLGGKLSLLAGHRDDACRRFEQCASRNALGFSPLLATKTVEAAFTAGLMHAWDRNLDAARRWWSRGLEQAGEACRADWREVVGPPDQPFGFGLRELGSVLDQAARCAAGLNAIAVWDTAPGRLAELLLNDCVTDRARLNELEAARETNRRADLQVSGKPKGLSHNELPHFRNHLVESTDRLKHLRAALAGRAYQPPRRIVIADAGDDGRRLWEALAPLGTVEIVAFVDMDMRQQGRALFGTTVQSPHWLADADFDLVAIAEGRAPEWQFVLAKAGVQSRQTCELPIDERDSAVTANAAAAMFPDPLAGVLAIEPSAAALRVGIFGTGAAGMKVWEVLATMDTADAMWFADNNARQHGTMILGLPVIAPADIPTSDVDVIVVGSMSRDPIRRQLLAIGIQSDAILTPNVTAPLDELRRQITEALMTATLERVS